MTPNESLLTVDEVAKLLRVDQETVRRYARLKRLKGVRLPGGTWRFRPSAVDALLAEERGTDPAEVAS